MKSICLYFQIHQPFRLKRYRFFDVGADHYYYDDYKNESIIRRIASNSYLKANALIGKLIEETGGKFHVAFSISGVALDQLEQFCPEVIESFKTLSKTGCVEFLGETYAHSLASLRDGNEFELQVAEHCRKIEDLFGQKPSVFRNTELIYSDEIGDRIMAMGFKGVITEGAKHVLGWKSPNYVYCSAANPSLKMLMKNFGMSDDIAYRFSNWGWSEYPLTAEKFVGWISDNSQEQVVNLFMNYEVLGEIQQENTGIFEFFKSLPFVTSNSGIEFKTPSEVIDSCRPVDQMSVPYPISWANETRDLSAWLGNKLQNEAFNKIFSMADKVRLVKDRLLIDDWYRLLSSDHLYYMSTAYYNQYFCPYDSPYDAFINFMNVLSDFKKRVDSQFPAGVDNEELNSLVHTINTQDDEIERLKAEVESLKQALADKPVKESAAKSKKTSK